MSSTSLGAYAAWLAKHESKARRRSLESTSDSSEAAVVEEEPSVAARKDKNVYSKWAKRKETKLPAVRVVVASPDSVEAVADREQVAPAKTTAVAVNKNRASGRERDQNDVSNGHENTIHKGKKRAAPAAPSIGQTAKKNKSSSPPLAKKRTTEDEVLRPVGAVASTSTQAKPNACRKPVLPMIEEVRYWQDVDRFSFLA